MKKLMKKTASVGVIGLGYVGMPTALLLAKTDFRVIGFDKNRMKIQKLRQGLLPFGENEPGLKRLFASVRTNPALHFHPTEKEDFLSGADIFLIAVDSPIDQQTKKPTYSSLRSALKTVGRLMKKHAVVIVESTIAPSTTETIVIPKLEKFSGWKAGRDFTVLHCPERITPGKTLFNITHLDRVIGARNKKEGEVGKTLYQSFCKGHIDITSYRTAEIVKTAENAQRDVEIAFANELAQICDAYGVDFFDVKELIERVPNRRLLLPGGGVGGHCLPKDSWLLLANLHSPIPSSIITNARTINDAMPMYVLRLLDEAFRSSRQSLKGKKIAILGYSYREETDDARMSPSETLRQLLMRRHATVTIHDPYVKDADHSLERALYDADAAVVMVAHSAYKNAGVLTTMKKAMRGNILIDGRAVFSKRSVERVGFVFRGIGRHAF